MAGQWIFDEIGGTVGREGFDLLIGKWLGTGSARRVYVLAQDRTKVIKFETKAQSFQNVQEWELWKSVSGTKWEEYFAPCYDISISGSALIQARTMPTEKRPKWIPEFMNDVQLSNFGRYKGRIVFHDYGYHNTNWLAKKKAILVKTKDVSADESIKEVTI